MEDYQETLRLYAEQGIPTCDFLRAVLCNNLGEACGRADYINKRRLPEIVAYIQNNLPAACWGSATEYEGWLERKRLERIKKKEGANVRT
jgi:hypothetical protein